MFIGSKVKSHQGINLFESLICLRVQLVGSIGSRVQLVQEFNWFKHSIGVRVYLMQGFNWFKGSMSSRVKFVQ